jgi:toxin ParE1/3/4
MSVALIRSPESMRDVEGIVQHFIDEHAPATAIKFGKSVMKTLKFLAAFPEIGAPWESRKARLQGVRFQNVRGYKNYLVFYRMVEDGLYVMRVIDGRRDLERVL